MWPFLESKHQPHARFRCSEPTPPPPQSEDLALSSPLPTTSVCPSHTQGDLPGSSPSHLMWKRMRSIRDYGNGLPMPNKSLSANVPSGEQQAWVSRG